LLFSVRPGFLPTDPGQVHGPLGCLSTPIDAIMCESAAPHSHSRKAATMHIGVGQTRQHVSKSIVPFLNMLFRKQHYTLPRYVFLERYYVRGHLKWWHTT